MFSILFLHSLFSGVTQTPTRPPPAHPKQTSKPVTELPSLPENNVHDVAQHHPQTAEPLKATGFTARMHVKTWTPETWITTEESHMEKVVTDSNLETTG